MGDTPSQVCMGRGVPHPADRGVPIPGLDGGYPGVPPSKDWKGYPPTRTGWGTPLVLGWGTPHPVLDGVLPPPPPIRQSGKASTYYATGGMPLAFTQEDFLVKNKFFPFISLLTSHVCVSWHTGFFPNLASRE